MGKCSVSALEVGHTSIGGGNAVRLSTRPDDAISPSVVADRAASELSDAWVDASLWDCALPVEAASSFISRLMVSGDYTQQGET